MRLPAQEPLAEAHQRGVSLVSVHLRINVSQQQGIVSEQSRNNTLTEALMIDPRFPFQRKTGSCPSLFLWKPSQVQGHAASGRWGPPAADGPPADQHFPVMSCPVPPHPHQHRCR